MRIPTYEMFNYNFRPAKSIERRIFIDVLKHIYGINPGNDCSYIGLGSIFFPDFKLIHKELNVNNMINIEFNQDDEDRFKFNKPFKCIDLKWGKSTDVLPTLNWSGRKIVWMDYDDKLDTFMFDDLESIFSNLNEGSFYFFTCNYSLGRYENRSTQVHDSDRFLNDFEGIAPIDVKPQNLVLGNSPMLIRRMLIDKINKIFADRNSMTSRKDQLIFKQLLNIKYKDGAPMYSLGGYITSYGRLKEFDQKSLNKYPYIVTGEVPLDLQAPIITNQEIDLMNSYLPHRKSTFLNLRKIAFIPEVERQKYFETYRYYPNFAEVKS